MAGWELAHLYRLFAVLVVASVQLFFSVWKGGFFVAQWYWGVGIILVTLVGAALIPGYFSTLGRKQWALVGTLLLLLAVVTASILWSISAYLSIHEASRTAMYVGAFILLLPAATQWGSLIVDATIFGALLPPAIYGLLQKILPTYTSYTGITSLQSDPRASSTVGYHTSLGVMCAMGALLVTARLGSFRSVLLRAFYSALGVLFLVPLYFSFSRGALLALALGALVLLVLTERRFEMLGNLAIISLPALWVVLQARDYPGLVARPVSFDAIKADGLSLIWLMLVGLLLAFAGQVLFTLFVRAAQRSMPEGLRHGARLIRTVIVVAVVAGSLFLGWSALQHVGGFEGLQSQITNPPEPEQETAVNYADQTNHLATLSAENRVRLWKLAWENWLKHPFTGTGGNTYQLIYAKEAPPEWAGGTPGSDDGMWTVHHPHSMWMSLLSDTGIFAFLAFAAFCIGGLALACYNAFYETNSLRSRALLAGSAAAATAYIVSSSLDWNWYIPASTLPFFALAAVAAADRTPYDAGETEADAAGKGKSANLMKGPN